MSYCDIILEHLKKNKKGITELEAFEKYQITCLAQRIHDLRDKYNIKTEMVTSKNGKRYGRYYLI